MLFITERNCKQIRDAHLSRNFKVSISPNELNSCPQTCQPFCSLGQEVVQPSTQRCETESGDLLLALPLTHPYTSHRMSFLLPWHLSEPLLPYHCLPASPSPVSPPPILSPSLQVMTFVKCLKL